VLGLLVMKTKLKSVADELRDDLLRCPDLRAQQLIDLDESISVSMGNLTSSIKEDQKGDWEALKEKIDELREFAQVAKMRLLYGDDELGVKLDAMHEFFEGENDEVGEVNEINEKKAAIEIAADAHKPKGITDVFKALLMWKDSPEERMK
jgi:hypothetical protein